jgi:hypothetical protein
MEVKVVKHILEANERILFVGMVLFPPLFMSSM